MWSAMALRIAEWGMRWLDGWTAESRAAGRLDGWTGGKCDSTSWTVIRPPRPVPLICDGSSPRSLSMRRTAERGFAYGVTLRSRRGRSGGATSRDRPPYFTRGDIGIDPPHHISRLDRFSLELQDLGQDSGPGAAISTVTLSVVISSRGSSRFTGSPTDLNHLPTVLLVPSTGPLAGRCRSGRATWWAILTHCRVRGER